MNEELIKEWMSVWATVMHCLIGGITPVKIDRDTVEKFQGRRIAVKTMPDGSIHLLDADTLHLDLQEDPINWVDKDQRMQVLYNAVAAYNRMANNILEDPSEPEEVKTLFRNLLRKGHNALLWPKDQLPPFEDNIPEDPPLVTERITHLAKTCRELEDLAEQTVRHYDALCILFAITGQQRRQEEAA
jgi:hypothetical protein